MRPPPGRPVTAGRFACWPCASARRGPWAALEEACLDLPAALARYGPWSEERAWAAAAGLIGDIRAGAVDAVFCASDEIGRGVADGLRDAGVRVPDDAALVGVDGRPPATSCLLLLTTVDLQLEQIGRVAAQELLARIAGGTATGARLLPGRLIVRASSGRSALLTGARPRQQVRLQHVRAARLAFGSYDRGMVGEPRVMAARRVAVIGAATTPGRTTPGRSAPWPPCARPASSPGWPTPGLT